MPLSEREQQILDELEKELRGERATSSRQRSRGSVERLRGLKLGVVLVVLGVVMLVLFFASRSLMAGVFSFAAMVGGIVLAASSIRSDLRREGARDRIVSAVGRWEQSLRRRYRDEE